MFPKKINFKSDNKGIKNFAFCSLHCFKTSFSSQIAAEQFLFPVINIILLVLLLPAVSFAQAPPPQADVEDICLICHRADELTGSNKLCSRWMKHSHPVNVTPSERVKVPKKFPLNKGQIYCGTCHTTGGSQSDEDKNAKIYSNKVFLRYENNNSSLCKECHTQMKGKSEGYISRTLQFLVTVPNLNDKEDPGVAGKVVTTFNHPVDLKTDRMPKAVLEAGGSFGTSKNLIICETCHVTHQASSDKLLIVDNRNSDICGLCHPEMLAYDRNMASRRGTHPVNVIPSLAPVADRVMDMGGKVEDQGKIICLTCHRVHQATVKKSLLVMENDHSSFCIVCHEDKSKFIVGTKHDLRLSAPKEKNLLGQVPEESGPCGGCHVAHRGSGHKMWAKEILDDYVDAITQLCESCHTNEGCASEYLVGDFSHSVGVSILGVEASHSSFPLFNPVGARVGQGNVTCATCHNVHRWAPDSLSKGSLKINGDATNSFLRMKNIKSSLCKDCHSDMLRIVGTKHDPMAKIFNNFEIMKDENGVPLTLCEQCHVSHNANSVMLWNRDVGDAEDEISRICFSCHTAGAVAAAKQVGEHSHPIGRSILKLSSYFRRFQIDLPLFNEDMRKDFKGRVFCNSCHNVHQWSPNNTDKGSNKKVEGDVTNSFLRKTTLSDKKGGLCSTCHLNEKLVKGTDHDLRVTAPAEKNLRNKTAREEGLCYSCHTAHNAAEGFALWNKKFGEGNDPVSQRCNSCHQKNSCAEKKLIGASHPVGVEMDIQIKTPNMPVYDEKMRKINRGGKVYCSSCHNSHQWMPGEEQAGKGKNQEGDNGSSFLRVSNKKGKRLCLDCHQDKKMIKGTKHDLAVTAPGEKNIFKQSAKDIGLCDTCHSVHHATQEVKLWARKLGPGADSISQLCSSCHVEKGCAGKKVIGQNTHPVNVKMHGVANRPNLPLFKVTGEKEEEGVVTCASCHDLHKWDAAGQVKGKSKLAEGTPADSFLRIANLKSPDLCQECHQEKMSIVKTPHNLAISVPDEKNIMGETAAESGLCRSCHITHNSPYAAMLSARKPGPNTIKNWNEDLVHNPNPMTGFCTSCHYSLGSAAAKQPEIALHLDEMFILQKQAKTYGPALNPVPFVVPNGDFPPTISVASIDIGFPAKFPLFDDHGDNSWNGHITCSTCHDSHQLNAQGKEFKADPVEQGGISNKFLRVGVANELCSDCHGSHGYFLYTYYHRARPKKPMSTKSVHWSSEECLVCHESKPREGEEANLKFGGDVIKLCTSCHDGSKAPHAIHPNKVAVNAGNGKIKVPLYDDKINCLTCHDFSKHYKFSSKARLQNPAFIRFIKDDEDIAKIKKLKGKTQSIIAHYQSKLCFECHEEKAFERFNPHKNQLNDKKEINEQICLLCHTDITKGKKGADPYRLRGSIDKFCIGCHPGRTQRHPFNANHYGKKFTYEILNTLKMFMRVDFGAIPIYNQKLVCPTCHNPHQAGVPTDLFGRKGGKKDVRALFVGYGSCSACHSSVGTPASGAPF